MTISGPHLAPRTPPKQLVVILHGWGADGANLIDLADSWAGVLPEAYFIAPNGPEVCEVNPYGYQWFSLMNRDPAVMLAGARRAAEHVNALLDAKQKEFGLTNAHTALVGFSQGTMTALQVALRRAPDVACVVGYSGALIGAETLGAELKARPSVCLIHGESDEVVPFAAMAHAEAALKASSVPVETHARPFLGHSIDMEGLKIGAGVLKRALG